ncbi:MAG: sigma-70 family RNA polymerase sigma factor [Gelidibacter sp.]
MGHPYKIDSQTELVHAIKTNDSVALKSLYTSNYYKIESLVLKNSGTREHAKDVYQEAFISVWNNIKNNAFVPQNDTALQGYLYQIAKNKWMDVLRSSRFKKTNLIHNEMTLVDKCDDPEHEEEQDRFKQKLKQAMDAFKVLGSPCKELLTTFYFEKKSLRDIAEELQIEENTARNKKYRCMEKLRELVLASKS